jgi:hypothetical protein
MDRLPVDIQQERVGEIWRAAEGKLAGAEQAAEKLHFSKNVKNG